MPYVAGVDAHKDSHSIVFLDPVGKLLQSLTVAANAEGYAREQLNLHEVSMSRSFGVLKVRDAMNAQAIAEAVLREAERLPRFQESGEREALRLRREAPRVQEPGGAP